MFLKRLLCGKNKTLLRKSQPYRLFILIDFMEKQLENAEFEINVEVLNRLERLRVCNKIFPSSSKHSATKTVKA